MNKQLITMIIIILMLSASPAFAQEITDEIKWGSDPKPTAQPSPESTPPGTTAPPPGPPSHPDTWHYYTGPGTNQVLRQTPLTNTQLNTLYPGYSYSGEYKLSNTNIEFLQAQKEKNPEAVPKMDDYKIVVNNPDGTHDISVGPETFDSWSGPEKFSSGSNPLEMYYDKKQISSVSEVSGQKSITLDDGTMLGTVPNGIIEFKESQTTIYDQKGGVVNSFTNKEWEEWQPVFESAGDSNIVPLAFTIHDLSLDIEDIQKSDGSKAYGEDFVIEYSAGTFTVKSGGEYDSKTNKMSGDYTDQTYTVVNGQKQISQLTKYENAGTPEEKKTTYSYPTASNPNFMIDGKTVGTVSNDEWIKGQMVLSVVNGVQVVRDDKGSIQYYKNGKKLNDKETAEFEEKNEEKLDELSEKNDEITAAEGEKDYQELPPEKRERFHSFGQFLTDFVDYYRQYSGMAGWSSLIFDEDFLKEWRQKVNDAMCTAIGIPLTKECFVSKVCGEYSDIVPTSNGVLFSTPVGGAPAAVAHIEGQRSLPIVAPNETSWIYKITYSISNPEDETMNFNIRFIGPQKTALWWHQETRTLTEGASASGTGSSALIRHSPNDYREVCLEFSPKITSFDGKRIGKLCNDIVQAAPVPTSPYYAEEEETITPGAAPTQAPPSTPGATV